MISLYILLEFNMKQGGEKYTMKYHKNHFYFLNILAPPLVQLFYAQNWKVEVRFLIALVDLTFPGFPWFFSETRVNTGQDSLERPLWKGFYQVPDPTSGQSDLNLQPTNQPKFSASHALKKLRRQTVLIFLLQEK